MKSPLLADRMGGMEQSTIREILKITKQPDIISFAGGLPAPELFPSQTFAAAIAEAMRDDATGSLQYDVTEGYLPLKEFLADWLTRQGLRCSPDHLFLTNGSQQALDLIGKVFLNPKDSVVVENPTYLGAVQAFNAYQAKYRSVPMDQDGILIPPLEKEAAKPGSKFIYLVPTFQNPSGITMSLERRKEVIRVAHRHKKLIIEDDPYSYLRYRGKAQPSLYSLADGKGVMYLSTFSKILSPGIRLGFVVAKPENLQPLIVAKQAADLQPNSLIQRAVYRYARAGHLDAHIPNIVNSYKARSEVMREAIGTYFPKEIRWVDADGGMFIWCELPRKASASAIFRDAIAKKVAYVTGSVFHPNGGGDHTLRLNFTNSSPPQITEGIKRLGEVFRSAFTAA